MAKLKQGIPMILSADSTSACSLLRVPGATYTEDYIQEIVYEHPILLPVDDIDPVFSGLLPICREFRTSVGRIDALYVNELGMLTLVECKLWRNPESRRKVVGQILDYAQVMSQMSYKDLDERITKQRGQSLYACASEAWDDLEESDFIDAVSRNLRLGRFLLLVVGDGIREETQHISRYLQRHANLNFTFGLVELGLYQTPDGGVLVQPNTLVKTIEIGRHVIRTDTGESIVLQDDDVEPAINAPETNPICTTVTEQVYFEMIASQSPKRAQALRSLFQVLMNEKHLERRYKKSGVMFKSETGFSVIIFRKDGRLRNYACKPDQPEYALYLDYQNRLAEILCNAEVKEAANGFHTTVMKSSGGLCDIDQLLENQDAFLELMDWLNDQVINFE